MDLREEFEQDLEMHKHMIPYLKKLLETDLTELQELYDSLKSKKPIKNIENAKDLITILKKTGIVYDPYEPNDKRHGKYIKVI